MADENVVIDNKPTVTTDPFDGAPSPRMEFSKKEEPIIEPKKEEPVIIDAAIKTDVPIEDGRNYLKEKLGYDDWDSAKNEIEAFKTKAQTPAELKLEGLETAKIKELYAVIDKNEKLTNLLNGEVTKDNAASIVKALMQEKYKGLNQGQIEYKFNKQFGVPKEPVQGEDSDEEFQERKAAWQEIANNAEMELLIEANISRPELQKIKSELKLPEIQHTANVQKELSPEELANIQKGRELFVNDAITELKKFDGFSAQYKDKDVEIQSNYKLSDEENAVVLNHIKDFAQSGYDANVLFGKRWVKDGKFDFMQMAKDLAVLETENARSQKYIGDAAAKAKLQYLKQKHNIDLDNGNKGNQLQLADTDRQKKSEDALWYN